MARKYKQETYMVAQGGCLGTIGKVLLFVIIAAVVLAAIGAM